MSRDIDYGSDSERKHLLPPNTFAQKEITRLTQENKQLQIHYESEKRRADDRAAENERLRQELHVLSEESALYMAHRDELAAYVERLREFIERTYDEYNSTGRIGAITALQGGRLLIDEPSASLKGDNNGKPNTGM